LWSGLPRASVISITLEQCKDLWAGRWPAREGTEGEVSHSQTKEADVMQPGTEAE
jgi:hypothetical protein